MDAQITVYITLVTFSGVLNLFLCMYVYFKRHQYPNLSTFFILQTAATTIYCLGYSFSLTSTTIEQLKFWNVVQYIGIPFAPPLGLLFVMKYLGISIRKTYIAAILTLPTLTFIVDATNEIHHLHYRLYEIDPAMGAPYIYKEYGVWFLIHGIYVFSCMLIASFLLISRWKETAKNYRRNLFVLLCGQLIPLITAFLFLINMTPTGVDPVPMVAWLTSVMFLWSIHSSRMLSILPIAKNTIFNSINDGVIVLDESLRLIEFNRACQEMLPALQPSMYGQYIDKLWNQLLPVPLDLTAAHTTEEVKISREGQVFIYRMQISSFSQGNYRSGFLIIFTDITELKQLQQQLERQAYYDELTGIFNRRAFFKQAEQMYAQCKSKQLPFSIIMFDIDYFKQINDTYGHLMGDHVLLHIATLCKAQLADNILLARYGGEEMVIALPGYGLKQGEQLASALREHIERTPLHHAQTIIPVTASFGVAAANHQLHNSLSLILQHADEALYKAKRAGRNQVQIQQ